MTPKLWKKAFLLKGHSWKLDAEGPMRLRWYAFTHTESSKVLNEGIFSCRAACELGM